MTRDWKAEAVKQWNADPCGADDGSPFGSPEFFRRVEAFRYRQYAPWLKEVAGFDRFAGRRVLEIGFGLGTDLMAFARGGAECFGIDLTPTHIEATRRRFALDHRPVHLVRGDAESLPLRDGSFDLVYSFGVLHHTPDTKRAIREAHRVLRPSGRAIVGLYHLHSLFYWNLFLWRGLFRAGFLRDGYRRTLSKIERREHSDAFPLVKLHSPKSARRLFADFAEVQTEVHCLSASHAGVLGTAVQKALGLSATHRLIDRLESRLGWYIVVKARKR